MKSPKSYEVGYKKPPVDTRFKKGKSGNAGGRPPGQTRQLPHETVLGQMVTIQVNGERRRVTAGEAFLLQIHQQALAGDGSAARALLAAIAKARGPRLAEGAGARTQVIVTFLSPGNVNSSLVALRMARVLDRFGKGARVVLEPMTVEDALTGLGEKRLTLEEQRIVLDATRTPHKVNWPDWWEVRE